MKALIALLLMAILSTSAHAMNLVCKPGETRSIAWIVGDETQDCESDRLIVLGESALCVVPRFAIEEEITPGLYQVCGNYVAASRSYIVNRILVARFR